MANIWCNPGQDNQTIIAPKRITPVYGVVNNCTILNANYQLPDANSTYHIFQIGGIDSIALGLYGYADKIPKRTWTPIIDACNLSNMVVNVYNDNGVNVPLHTVYYIYTSTGDMVVAISEHLKVPIDYKNEQLYIRLYNNSYFKTHPIPVGTTNVFGLTISTAQDIATFITRCSTYVGTGLLYAYVNGYLVNKHTYFNIALGDVVEAVWDPSVLKVVAIPLTTMSSFTSVADNKSKYIVHYPDDGFNVIEYYDDNDIYVVYKQSATKEYGVFYHNNAIDATRMLTHRDYSIVVPYVDKHKLHLQNQLNAGLPINQSIISINLIIRRPSVMRPLVNNASMVNELYKLPDATVVQCLNGVVGSPTIWHASRLENTRYAGAMSALWRDILSVSKDPIITGNIESFFLTAYNYNNVATIYNDSPKLPYAVGMQLMVDIPPGLQANSTAYMYDINGLYIGNVPSVRAPSMVIPNPACAVVEWIHGTASMPYIFNNVTVNPQIQTITTKNSNSLVNVYQKNIAPTGWSDTWVGTSTTQLNPLAADPRAFSVTVPGGSSILVKSDNYLISYDTIINLVQGVYKFTLTENIIVDGVVTSLALTTAPVVLDIFLNGYSLIESVDYIVNYPEVTIINVSHLLNNATGPQSVHVRGIGNTFDVTWPISMIGGVKDSGWVAYNLLSNNNKYDITDSKIQRIVVGGRLLDKSKVVFSENHTGVGIPSLLNGLPYQITDVPINPDIQLNEQGVMYPVDIIGTKEAEMLQYKDIANYMNNTLPQPPRVGPNVIPSLYRVYSPFMSSIIDALLTNVITDAMVMPNLSDPDITAICDPYLPFYTMDPLLPSNLTDSKYMQVTPHPHAAIITLPFFKYRFLNNVVRLYGNNLITLSNSVALL